MAQKKAHEVDGWLGRPDPGARVVLIYGPDRGLVSERAKRFAAATGLPLDDPFSVVKLSAGVLDAEPGRLVDEARTVPMFAAQRLIWVLDAGAEKGFAESVKALLDAPVQDAVVLIEAGDLKKGSALRATVETAAAAMALPCYADDARGIDRLIDEELARAGLSISLDARQLLKSALGGDRLATRAELEKLTLYCAGGSRVEVEDVRLATGDVSALSADAAVDAVLAGRIADFDSAFAQLMGSGVAPFLPLAAALRQFQALMLLRQGMDRDRKSASAAVAGARPPVFFTRRALVENALKSLPVEAMARAAERINAAILETRRRPDLARAVARQALLATAIESNRAQR
jgi:DNA polymerase III subunit delta